jgi:hypothetical protein
LTGKFIPAAPVSAKTPVPNQRPGLRPEINPRPADGGGFDGGMVRPDGASRIQNEKWPQFSIVG